MDKCKFCKKVVKQYMATSTGNLTRRYYVCKNCRTIFVEYLFIPWQYKSVDSDEKVYFENVLGNTDNLVPFKVFKVIHRKLEPVTKQSSLFDF